MKLKDLLIKLNQLSPDLEIEDQSEIEAMEQKLPYVICRTYSAGVFAGFLSSKEGKEVILLKARRIWYWDGAFTLSQLAMEGTKKPENCKFPLPVDKVCLTEVIEILNTTRKAQKSIEDVAEWKS